jgi:ribosomal protein S19
VEGAEIAHKFMKQICRAPHAAHWIETRMSVALPVPEKLRENTSGFGKVAGNNSRKQTIRTYLRFLTLIPEFVRSFVSMFSSVSWSISLSAYRLVGLILRLFVRSVFRRFT